MRLAVLDVCADTRIDGMPWGNEATGLLQREGRTDRPTTSLQAKAEIICVERRRSKSGL